MQELMPSIPYRYDLEIFFVIISSFPLLHKSEEKKYKQECQSANNMIFNIKNLLKRSPAIM